MDEDKKLLEASGAKVGYEKILDMWCCVSCNVPFPLGEDICPNCGLNYKTEETSDEYDDDDENEIIKGILAGELDGDGEPIDNEFLRQYATPDSFPELYKEP